jgi:hypothetical protein
LGFTPLKTKNLPIVLSSFIGVDPRLDCLFGNLLELGAIVIEPKKHVVRSMGAGKCGERESV